LICFSQHLYSAAQSAQRQNSSDSSAVVIILAGWWMIGEPAFESVIDIHTWDKKLCVSLCFIQRRQSFWVSKTAENGRDHFRKFECPAQKTWGKTEIVWQMIITSERVRCDGGGHCDAPSVIGVMASIS
jgi:hypothetical protein